MHSLGIDFTAVNQESFITALGKCQTAWRVWAEAVEDMPGPQAKKRRTVVL